MVVHGESGSTLVVGLVILLVLTILGVVGMQTTTLEERMAGNLRDRDLAFQAAEAALREGEYYLQAAVLPAFDGTNGLYQPLDPASSYQSRWATLDWTQTNASWEYDGEIEGVNSQPRYIIEELPTVQIEGESVKFDELPDIGMFRVTSRAVGGTETAVVILQTIYRR